MSPDTLLEVLGLKALPRAGWARVSVENPESVAAHSWGVAWLALVLLPPHLDRARALSYAVLHDLPEVRVGDITPADGVSRAEKHTREQAAAESLFSTRPDLLDLWQAYERQEDPESRFVRQLDRLDMALQAVHYAREGTEGVEQFLDSAAQVITDPTLVAILRALRE